jgi:plastocyanin
MSILGKRISLTAIAAMAAVMILAVLAPALSKTPSREITLVAKGMAFYLESDLTTPNPTLEIKAGERVRITLRNQDRGITHDLAVPALRKAVDQLTWNESDDVTFSAPRQPGTYQYECQPHRLMMRGTIRVY